MIGRKKISRATLCRGWANSEGISPFCSTTRHTDGIYNLGVIARTIFGGSTVVSATRVRDASKYRTQISTTTFPKRQNGSEIALASTSLFSDNNIINKYQNKSETVITIRLCIPGRCPYTLEISLLYNISQYPRYASFINVYILVCEFSQIFVKN